MSDYELRCQADARLVILAELARQQDATLNSVSLGRVLDGVPIRRTREWLETQLLRLQELGAVNVRRNELPGFGAVSIATITETGRNHVTRRALLAGVTAPTDEL